MRLALLALCSLLAVATARDFYYRYPFLEGKLCHSYAYRPYGEVVSQQFTHTHTHTHNVATVVHLAYSIGVLSVYFMLYFAVLPGTQGQQQLLQA